MSLSSSKHIMACVMATCAMSAGHFFVSQSFPLISQHAYLNDNLHGKKAKQPLTNGD